MKHFKLTLALVAAIAMLSTGLFAQTKTIGEFEFRYGTQKPNEDADMKEPQMYAKKLRLGVMHTSEDKTFGAFTYWDFISSVNSNTDTSEAPTMIYAYGWWKPMDMLKLVYGQIDLAVSNEALRSSGRMYAGNDMQGVVDATNASFLKTTFGTGLRAELMLMPELDLSLTIANSITTYTGLSNTLPSSETAADAAFGQTSPLFILRGAYQIVGKKVLTGTEAWAKGMGFNAGFAFGYQSDKVSAGDSNSLMILATDGVFYMDGAVFNYGFNYQMQDLDGTETKNMFLMVEAGYNLPVAGHGIMPAFRLEYGNIEPATGEKLTDIAYGIAVNLMWKNTAHSQKLTLAFLAGTNESGTTTVTETKYQKVSLQFQTKY